MTRHALSALVSIAALSLLVGAAQAESRWTRPPYVQSPPLVGESDAALREKIVAISTFPTVLDPRLWDGQRLRADVRTRVLDVIDALFSGLGLADVSIKAVEVRGSNVSYEYDDAADFGVRVFLDTSKYKGDIGELAARIKTYNAYIEVKHEGQVFLYGVPLETNFYVIRTPRLDPQPGVGHYSITDDAWLEKPTAQESRFDRAQMFTDTKRFVVAYNDLVQAYFADKRAFDCDRLTAFDKALGDYRNAGIEASGTRSTENLTYRLLRRLSVNVVDGASALELECRNIHWSLD